MLGGNFRKVLPVLNHVERAKIVSMTVDFVAQHTSATAATERVYNVLTMMLKLLTVSATGFSCSRWQRSNAQQCETYYLSAVFMILHVDGLALK